MYKEVFAGRLKEARKNSGLTQKEVGNITGISQSNLTKYETERAEPNIETLGILANLYNVTSDWLIGLGHSNTRDNHDKTLQEIKERKKILQELERMAK